MALLLALGLLSGLLAGVLGIGGGSVLVPLIKGLGYTPLQAVATSSLAIILTSFSASLKNLKDGTLPAARVLSLALPALVCAQLGVMTATLLAPRTLLFAFALFLVANVGLAIIKKSVTRRAKKRERQLSGTAVPQREPVPAVSAARMATGALAGFLAGVFPSQMGISWEGHLFGFIGGAIAAKMVAQEKKSQS